MNVCKICENQNGNKSYLVREMMFGTREEFEYFECASCGCLQIKNIPEDISKYYPKEYVAYSPVEKVKDNFVKAYLKLKKTRYCLYNEKTLIGFVLAKMIGCGFVEKVKKGKVQLDTKILDVGSGYGRRLISLQRDGFTNITGIDPFIEKDIEYPNGLKIYKKELDDVRDEFDFVMLNHSFEHMSAPLSVLKKLFTIVKPDGYVMIRTPVAGSYAWKKYGVNWLAIDPPRHFFIHTPKSMELLAQQAGFIYKDILYDSMEYQFWASEQYLKGIPLTAANSYYCHPEKSIFTKKQIKAYKAHAEELNRKGEGDAACFYLYKPGK